MAGHLDRLAHRRRPSGPRSVDGERLGGAIDGEQALGVGHAERALAPRGRPPASGARRRTARARGRRCRVVVVAWRRPSRPRRSLRAARRRPPRRRRAGTGAATPGSSGRGDIAANLSSAHGRPRSASRRCSWRSTADRSRSPTTAASLLDVLRDDPGAAVAEGRLQPPGPVRVLHRARRRAAPRRVRHPGAAGRRSLDHDRRRPRRPRPRSAWADAFCATGASQCGFCTPGIICRLEGLRAKGARAGDHAAVEQALLAHLCRCTGWRTILDAWDVAVGIDAVARRVTSTRRRTRAAIEGGGPQAVGPEVALGQGGFADDTAPADALVAVPDGAGGWVVGETLAEAGRWPARCRAAAPPWRPRPRSTLPAGDWAATLRTSWVEPAYLEPDASWCEPGGEPRTPAGQRRRLRRQASTASVTAAAATLADQHGRAVRVLLDREDVVRLGPKRPPVAGGADADGRGVLRVVRTPGHRRGHRGRGAPTSSVEEVDVAGPPTSADLRAAGWAEATVLLAGARGRRGPVDRPDQRARPPRRRSAPTAPIRVRVDAGEVLDEVVLRSYATGAAHMALSWVSSEGIAVDEAGTVHDLTIRSFGVLRAVDTPPIEIELVPATAPPCRGSRRGVRRGGGGRVAAPRLPGRLAHRRPLALTDWPPCRRPSVRTPRSCAPATGSSSPARSGISDGKLVHRRPRRRAAPGDRQPRRAARRRGRLPRPTSPRPPCSCAHLGSDYPQMNEVYMELLRRPPPGPVGHRRGRAPARCPGGGGSLGPRRGRMTAMSGAVDHRGASSSWSSPSRSS